MRAILHPAHSTARRLAGKLPYYCDAEIGETPSRVGGAVTVGIPRGGSAAAEVRGAGWGGPGPREEGTAEPRPSVSRVLRGTAVRARLPEGRLRLRAPPVTARGRARGEVGARRLQCLRGAGARGPRARLAGVLGALPLTSRALAPGEAGSRSRDGGAPRPDSAACGLGGTATPKVKKRILSFLPARPYLNSGASATRLR